MNIAFIVLLLAVPLTVAQRAFAPPHPLRKSKVVPVDPFQSHNHARSRTLASSTSRMHNLVIPIRFADHSDRELPTPSELDVVFNSVDGDADRQILAPTGSVRDVFHFNSYHRFDVISTVLPWTNLTYTELDASSGSYGMSASLLDALYEALSLISISSLDMTQFDSDGDGIIDMITFLHSGYMAEWGGADCYGREEPFRLWSHKWTVPPDLQRDDQNLLPLKMDSYIIASALWGKCGSTIARIGLLSHELCHFLGPGSTGLEDLYDTSPGQEGRGLGSYDLLSDTWGRDYTQLLPPMMSPWTKAYLGWLEPTIITASGDYSLSSSANTPSAFRINAGFKDGEYLLIENRQPVGFDSLISAGGFAIYLVDEKAPWQERRGFPTQAGWPQNSNHYKIALLQADGNYDLEQGRNTGDSGDLWHANSSSNELGPGSGGTEVDSSVYPNTDSYQSGVILSTGIVISEFSETGEVMSLRISSPHLAEPFLRNEATYRVDNELVEIDHVLSAEVAEPEDESMDDAPSHGDIYNSDSSGALPVATSLSCGFLLIFTLGQQMIE